MDMEEFQNEKLAKIIEFRQEYEDGNLTEDEYNELVEDMLDIEKIIGKLQTEEDKKYTQGVIEKLKKVASLVKKVI